MAWISPSHSQKPRKTLEALFVGLVLFHIHLRDRQIHTSGSGEFDARRTPALLKKLIRRVLALFRLPADDDWEGRQW